MTGAALTAVLTIFLGARLTAHDYGVFAFALNVGLLCTLVADLRLSPSAGRLLAAHRDAPAALRAVFRTALRPKLLLAPATSLVLLATAPLIADAFGTPD